MSKADMLKIFVSYSYVFDQIKHESTMGEVHYGWGAILKSSFKYFMPLVSFYTSAKYQKASSCLMFSEGVGRDQWHEMG